MRLAILQLDTVWEQKQANFNRVNQLLDSLSEPVDLICMPEMFATGFSMEAAALAEPPDGVTFQFLSHLAQTHKTAVVGTTIEAGHHGGRNTCLVFDKEGRLLTRYAKIHPFSLAGEDKHYEKGAELPLATVGDFQVATPICYDLRFPELFRLGLIRGATLFVVPANWPLKRLHHWRHLLVARAIENLCYVVGINRAGLGNDIEYPGQSLVVSPSGEIIADGGPGECIFTADIEAEAVASYRDHFRFHHDVRRDLFPDLFKQTVLAVPRM